MSADEGAPAIYFLGTAGAGKSSLVAAYAQWCTQFGLGVTTVNLDPGAESLPYEPDVDIREYVKLSEIMEEMGLGPNGAQIYAADLIALHLKQIEDDLSEYRSDVILVDTPGQIELFVFRQSGKVIVEGLHPERTGMVYCMDPYLSRTATGFASQLMLAATAQLRFTQPMLLSLTKSDMVDAESMDLIQHWALDPYDLEMAVQEEKEGMSSELATNLARVFHDLGLGQGLVPCSAVEGDGLDDLYAGIQAAVGSSEDATPEYDTFLHRDQEDPSDFGDEV